MKKIGFVIFIFLLSHISWSQEILFDERNLDSNKTAFFIDKKGGIYPELFIQNQRIKAAGGALIDFYLANPLTFDSICQHYQLDLKMHFEEKYNALQSAIITSKLAQFILPTDQSVTFLVHGFGKTFDPVDGKMTSPTEYNYLQHNLTKNHLTTNHYIPIFWDSYYQCCFSLKKKTNKAIFELFEEAQLNALQVGISLRQILQFTNVPTINLIGHSLGTKILTSALFNTIPSTIPTPKQTINIALIAPAIDGQTTFKHYFDRVDNQEVINNYNLFIFYNPKDFVLRKKDNYFGIFGPGVKKYGKTSLGCNYKNDAIKTKQFIHSIAPNVVVSLQEIKVIKKQHSLIFYLRSDALLPFIQFVENK